MGLGGEHLRASGARLIDDYRGLSVTGLTEAIRALPRSLAIYRRLVAVTRNERPDVFVAIDSPEINFRVARHAKQLGIPVVYYVPPQLWAWRAGRIDQIRTFASRVLVIFPFEEALYRQAGIPVDFVGHPLLDLARAGAPRREFLRDIGADPERPVVGLLPGSRSNEVARILPVLWEAARLVSREVPRVQFVVARAPNLNDRLFADRPEAGPHAPVVVTGRTDDVLAASDAVATASGTATVQAAIHGAPMVVVYRLSPLSYALGRRFVRVSTYAMANLIAGRRVVPELIQDECTPQAVAGELVRYLTEPLHARQTRDGLGEVRARLGERGASARVAAAVLEIGKMGRNGGR